MATTKRWQRWTQTSDVGFPKPKYRFTSLLKRVGDYVRTHPVDETGYQKIKDAAKFWAWYHDKRVRIIKHRAENGMWEVEVRLVEHHRSSLSHRRNSS